MLSSVSANMYDDATKAFNNGDLQKAVTLYDRACLNENLEACNFLGTLYTVGVIGVLRANKTTAKTLHKKACDGGLVKGCSNYKVLEEMGF
jgi:TPR repeat protein